MILLKLSLTLLSCHLFYGFWARLSESLSPAPKKEETVLRALVFSMLRSILGAQPDLVVERSLYLRDQGLRLRRYTMMDLGLSALAGFILLGILAGWFYFLLFQGVFTEILMLGRLAEPPTWIFTLGNNDLLTLALLGVSAALVSGLLGVRFFGSTFALVFVMIGMLSLAGAVSVLLMERWGLRARVQLRPSGPKARGENWWCLGLGFLVWVVAITVGAEIATWGLYIVPGVSAFDPIYRLVSSVVTLLLWSILEVFLSMAILHFYWLKYGQS